MNFQETATAEGFRYHGKVNVSTNILDFHFDTIERDGKLRPGSFQPDTLTIAQQDAIIEAVRNKEKAELHFED